MLQSVTGKVSINNAFRPIMQAIIDGVIARNPINITVRRQLRTMYMSQLQPTL